MMLTQYNAKNNDPVKLQRYFETAPDQFAAIRRLFAEISRAPNEEAGDKILSALVAQVQAFKFNSALPELSPISQLAGILEHLLQQIAETPSNLSLSILRTTASAVVLLETMSLPGLRPDLSIKPPVKVLAVDDDPISRIAVSSALRKAFKDPDLAYEGDSGLMLAATNTYEVIFLDVEMPGMNGYELCARIHETSANRTTPVIFVTSHSDFEFRSQSISGGGQDLIGKPFLGFELALKALTIVLRNRLHAERSHAQTLLLDRKSSVSIPVKKDPSPNASAGVPSPLQPTRPAESVSSLVDSQNARKPNDATPATLPPLKSDNPADAFFATALARIETIRDRLQDTGHESNPDARKKGLEALLADTTKLASDMGNEDVRPAARLCSELGVLLAKFLENPGLLIPSAQNAAVAALNLLEEFCTRGVKANLLSPEPRILLVDDDPVVLLALTNAVKTVFGKPENARSGQEALEWACQTPFDLIFLDIEMPCMDGFAACRNIHATSLNARTPIVFVTSHSDAESLGQAALSGCCGFVPKPALPAEITLRALTFVLRARLEEFKEEKKAD
jgi:CheY-like chemotaxis protein